MLFLYLNQQFQHTTTIYFCMQIRHPNPFSSIVQSDIPFGKRISDVLLSAEKTSDFLVLGYALNFDLYSIKIWGFSDL